jgi:hypothetical protein
MGTTEGKLCGRPVLRGFPKSGPRVGAAAPGYSYRTFRFVDMEEAETLNTIQVSRDNKMSRRSHPTTKARRQRQKLKRAYSRLREDCQLKGFIETTPEGAVRTRAWERIAAANAVTGAGRTLDARQ